MDQYAAHFADDLAAARARIKELEANMDGVATHTLPDILANALRTMIEMNGPPDLSTYHPKDVDLYKQHVREFQAAKDALALYEREKS